MDDGWDAAVQVVQTPGHILQEGALVREMNVMGCSPADRRGCNLASPSLAQGAWGSSQAGP